MDAGHGTNDATDRDRQNAAKLAQIEAIIDNQRITDTTKVRQIRKVLAPPAWTDTGTGTGYEEPYDPRD